MINKKIVRNILELEDELNRESVDFPKVHMIIKDCIMKDASDELKSKFLEAEFCTENILALPSTNPKRRAYVDKLVEIKNLIKEIIVNELLKNEETA